MPLSKEKQKKYTADWYQKNKGRLIANLKERRKERVRFVEELKKSRSCERCGESHPGCLDFHHLDPTQKDWDVNKMASFAYSEERILKEIAKCACWCSNCHRKHHWQERQDRRALELANDACDGDIDLK